MILLFSVYTITYNINELNKNVIVKTYNEYKELDLEYYCLITNCQKIKTDLFPEDNKTYTRNLNGVLVPTAPINIKYKLLSLNFDKNYNSILVYEPLKLQILLDNGTIYNSMIKLFHYINFIFFIIFTFMYFRNSFHDKKRNLLSLHDKETNIQEKYINLLNENINHELSTPISIIRGKVDKIQDIFKKIIDKNEKTVVCSGWPTTSPTCPKALSISIEYELQQLLDEDVPVIDHAIEAITTVMARTNNWKQIKYSNGNTSIYDIIYNVKRSLGNFTRSNIRYVISDNLKNITLNGDYKNGDLQLCIMNHIKNSSEAKANLIQFEGGLNEKKNILSLYVIDNGDGIRDKNGKILEPGRFEKVFDPYYSTKSDEPCLPRHIVHKWYCNIKENIETYFNISSMNTKPSTIKQIRGIGTYLNRTTLRNCGGDLKIMETSEQGTVFKITTAAKVKAN